MTGDARGRPRDRAAVRRRARRTSSAPTAARTSRSTPPSRTYLDELQAAGVPGPRGRQGRATSSPAAASTRTTRARPTSAALAATGALLRDLDARPGLHQPGRDRPALRPPQGRRGLPRALREIDAAVGGWLSSCATRRPARPHRRPRRRPDARPHRPHARARAAAGAVPRATDGRRHDGPLADVGATVAAVADGPRGDALPGVPFCTPLSRLPSRAAMPELPEVETIRRQLAPLVEGRVLAARRDPRPALVRCRCAPEELVDAVAGPARRAARPPRQVPRLGARGRGLPAHAPAHDRQRCCYDPPPDTPYQRVRFDARRRPRAALLRPAALRHRRAGARASAALRRRSSTRRLGVEPLGGELTGARCEALARGRRAPVKAFLLDQRRIAGVGQHLRRRGAVPRADPSAAPGRQPRRATQCDGAGATRSRARSRRGPRRRRRDDRRLPPPRRRRGRLPERVPRPPAPRASRARAAARRWSSSSRPGAGPTSASAASRGRGVRRARRPERELGQPAGLVGLRSTPGSRRRARRRRGSGGSSSCRSARPARRVRPGPLPD